MMPIEVKELIIRTTIVENNFSDAGQHKNTISKRELEKLKKEIIDSCTEQIIDKINREKER
ncbi:MAG: DUF5908 family protein [Sphingobacteriaceae bacterium]|jgi:hypothetical protein